MNRRGVSGFAEVVGYIHSGMDNPLLPNQPLQVQREGIRVRKSEKQIPMYILCKKLICGSRIWEYYPPHDLSYREGVDGGRGNSGEELGYWHC